MIYLTIFSIALLFTLAMCWLADQHDKNVLTAQEQKTLDNLKGAINDF